MDIVVLFAELLVLLLGYLFAMVMNEPYFFLAFAVVWAAVVKLAERWL